jgi:hypothetical protein
MPIFFVLFSVLIYPMKEVNKKWGTKYVVGDTLVVD